VKPPLRPPPDPSGHKALAELRTRHKGVFAVFACTCSQFREGRNHDALGTLLETNRLKIREPSEESTKTATSAAKKTGDYPQLSKQDMSIIALCIENKGEIVTDDFAISNVAKNLKLKIIPIMTKGIKDVGKWVHYCPGCRTNHSTGTECPACGTPLKRKLLKD